MSSLAKGPGKLGPQRAFAYSLKGLGFRAYLEVHCTYNLLSNCSYNPIVNPITTVALDILGL